MQFIGNYLKSFMLRKVIFYRFLKNAYQKYLKSTTVEMAALSQGMKYKV